MHVIDQAIAASETDPRELDAVAVTQGPGLVGSLMVGISAAKALAFSWEKPLVGVNHLEAHIASAHIENEIDFPFVALIVSGGHTNLYMVGGFLDFELLGSTRDDGRRRGFRQGSQGARPRLPGRSADRQAFEKRRPRRRELSEAF